MPYPSNVTVSDSATFDTLTRVSSHELVEAVTDPYDNGWNNVNVAELADMAYALPGDPNGHFAGYNVQSIWSNEQMTRVLPPSATWDDPSSAGATSLAATPGPAPGNLRTVASAFTHSVEHYDDFVTNAYQSYLGRTPAASEVAGWVGQMQRGLSDEQLEAGFIGSVEYINNHGGPGAGWVSGMYHDLLGRTPAQSEVNGWVTNLNNGMSPQAVAYGFAASVEREAQRVTADYLTFLGRTPAQSEVNGWVSTFQHGTSNEDVVAGFVGSPEYFQRQHSNVDLWLLSVYQNVLNRSADVDEFEGWRTTR
jgi:hypothetical protein